MEGCRFVGSRGRVLLSLLALLLVVTEHAHASMTVTRNIPKSGKKREVVTPATMAASLGVETGSTPAEAASPPPSPVGGSSGGAGSGSSGATVTVAKDDLNRMIESVKKALQSNGGGGGSPDKAAYEKAIKDTIDSYQLEHGDRISSETLRHALAVELQKQFNNNAALQNSRNYEAVKAAILQALMVPQQQQAPPPPHDPTLEVLQLKEMMNQRKLQMETLLALKKLQKNHETVVNTDTDVDSNVHLPPRDKGNPRKVIPGKPHMLKPHGLALDREDPFTPSILPREPKLRGPTIDLSNYIQPHLPRYEMFHPPPSTNQSSPPEPKIVNWTTGPTLNTASDPSSSSSSSSSPAPTPTPTPLPPRPPTTEAPPVDKVMKSMPAPSRALDFVPKDNNDGKLPKGYIERIGDKIIKKPDSGPSQSKKGK